MHDILDCFSYSVSFSSAAYALACVLRSLLSASWDGAEERTAELLRIARISMILSPVLLLLQCLLAKSEGIQEAIKDASAECSFCAIVWLAVFVASGAAAAFVLLFRPRERSASEMAFARKILGVQFIGFAVNLLVSWALG